MARWDSSARGAPEQASVEGARPEPRAVLLGRSVLAPIVLAATTVAAVGGAVLALLPAALRRRPAGRLGTQRAEPLAAPGPDPDASEPVTP